MPLLDLPAEGGCRCGHLRFRVTRATLFTAACHCRGCQRMTAGPYSLSAAIPENGLEVLQGDTAPAGADPAFGHRACPRCLSWVWTEHPMMEGFVNLRATMLDEPAWAAPFAETWTAEKLPFARSGAVRSFPGFPPPEEFAALLADYAAWARA